MAGDPLRDLEARASAARAEGRRLDRALDLTRLARQVRTDTPPVITVSAIDVQIGGASGQTLNRRHAKELRDIVADRLDDIARRIVEGEVDDAG